MGRNQIAVRCPKCSARLSAPVSGGSAKLRCGNCRAIFPGPLARPTTAAARPSNSAAVAAGVCVLVAIGLIMTFQSVSLMSGSGTIWIGVALVGGGVALAFFLRGPLWVRITTVLVLALALLNACSVERSMNDKRREIGNILRD